MFSTVSLSIALSFYATLHTKKQYLKVHTKICGSQYIFPCHCTELFCLALHLTSLHTPLLQNFWWNMIKYYPILKLKHHWRQNCGIKSSLLTIQTAFKKLSINWFNMIANDCLPVSNRSFQISCQIQKISLYPLLIYLNNNNTLAVTVLQNPRFHLI